MRENNKSTWVIDIAWGFKNSKIKQVNSDFEILGQIYSTYEHFGDKNIVYILIPREKKTIAEQRHKKNPEEAKYISMSH